MHKSFVYAQQKNLNLVKYARRYYVWRHQRKIKLNLEYLIIINNLRFFLLLKKEDVIFLKVT